MDCSYLRGKVLNTNISLTLQWYLACIASSEVGADHSVSDGARVFSVTLGIGDDGNCYFIEHLDSASGAF